MTTLCHVSVIRNYWGKSDLLAFPINRILNKFVIIPDLFLEPGLLKQ